MRAMSTMLVVAACLSGTSRARAASDNVTYSLGWTRLAGAEKCIASGALARAVETRLGRPAWAPSSARPSTGPSRSRSAANCGCAARCSSDTGTGPDGEAIGTTSERAEPKVVPRALPREREPEFSVRLQAQGGGVEKAVPFTQTTPVTASQAILGLEALREQ